MGIAKSPDLDMVIPPAQPPSEEFLIRGFRPQQYDHDLPEYLHSFKVLSVPECQQLITVGESRKLDYAGVGTAEGTTRVDREYRSVKSTTLPVHLGLDWLYDRIAHWAQLANKQYGIHIWGIGEPIQYLRYEVDPEQEQDGHYGWHQDIGGGIASVRKLSVVINLSDPASYDGCKLEIMTYKVSESEGSGRGDITMFPAYLPHRVTPITRGVRRAIVCWLTGPRFV